MNGNNIVRFMLRTPLHVLMGNTMLITVTGRRTGRKLAVPVNYYRDGKTLWILSSRDRTWWRNIRPGSKVMLHLDGTELAGIADVVRDDDAVIAQTGQYLRHFPAAAGPLGVKVRKGVANADDVARCARSRLFVRVCPLTDSR
jgi:hypothetical protein